MSKYCLFLVVIYYLTGGNNSMSRFCKFGKLHVTKGNVDKLLGILLTASLARRANSISSLSIPSTSSGRQCDGYLQNSPFLLCRLRAWYLNYGYFSFRWSWLYWFTHG